MHRLLLHRTIYIIHIYTYLFSFLPLRLLLCHADLHVIKWPALPGTSCRYGLSQHVAAESTKNMPPLPTQH
jgi:hypothetical protein